MNTRSSSSPADGQAPAQAPELLRVLRALRANRSPGLQFPAHFLGLRYERVDEDGARISMPLGAHCDGADGQPLHAALGVLADVAMAGAIRGRVGPTARIVTLSSRLAFAAAPPRVDRLVATSRCTLQNTGLAMPTLVAAVTVQAGEHACCTGEGTFAALDNRRGIAPHPMSATLRADELAPLSVDELDDAEREVFARATAASAGEHAGAGFLERFWQLLPTTDRGRAETRIDCGVHVNNRAAHLHGGVLLGLAACTSAAVAPAGWHLLDLSAQFLEPGTGPQLIAAAEAVRIGRNTAAVDCSVDDGAGRTTLRAQAMFVPPRAAG